MLFINTFRKLELSARNINVYKHLYFFDYDKNCDLTKADFVLASIVKVYYKEVNYFCLCYKPNSTLEKWQR